MLTPDTVLQGRYKIIRQLGQGGMGTVYEATDERLDTAVALKETIFSEERLRKQFEREARLLARLHHPALPRVSDHFSEGDGQFLVMQFIPGDDLSEMMARRNGPFSPEQVLTWADQLLDALDYLHTQEPQIIHRDIKPQNLKLTSRGQIILLDFGLAKGQAGDISRVTTSASIFGYTPNYAPLEQIQGLGTDTRSDLYSLSATIYHLLTATKPPDALTRAAALVNSQADPLVPATELNPAVDSEVSSVLQQAMAQNKDQRFASAAEMRKALHRTEQTSTVINRSEAQTILRPPAAQTVATAPTQANAEQPTAVAGETTVVRPLLSASRRRVVPWMLSAAALLVVAVFVLGFYVTRKPGEVSVPEPTPSPAALSEPTTSDLATPNATPSLEVKPSDDPKTSKRTDEPKKAPTPRPKSTRQLPNESEDPDPDMPEPPDVPGENIINGPSRIRVNPRGIPKVTVGPGGGVIRTFPDGSQLISGPDGSTVYVSPDGRRQVLSTGKHPNRRRPTSP